MKKTGTGIPAVLLCLAFLFACVCLSACVRQPAEAGEEAESVQKTEVNETPGTEQDQASENATEGSEKSEQAQASENAAEESEETKQETARRIRVTAGETVVVYELNDSQAARDLWEQLPLTVEAEDYSTNEKIFYPPEELDAGDAPLASGGAGVLAYYAPWGDIVMFYDSFGENGSLYELGRAVSGSEAVGEISGTVQIEQE